MLPIADILWSKGLAKSVFGHSLIIISSCDVIHYMFAYAGTNAFMNCILHFVITCFKSITAGKTWKRASYELHSVPWSRAVSQHFVFSSLRFCFQ